MVFCFVQNFFFGQHELEYLFYLSRNAQTFFPQNSTLVYMTKTLLRFFSKKNILIPNVAEKNILILVGEKKLSDSEFLSYKLMLNSKYF
jgi:hypothetical protein